MGAAMVTCPGDTVDHCCYIDGAPCRFLEEGTMPGRRWVCELRRRLGSWDAVHADAGYRTYVQPVWDKTERVTTCGDWPPRGVTCPECGQTGA